MGTGIVMKQEPKKPPKPSTTSLTPADKDKVSNIVEVCNVSEEEALRVLDACHMDATMAIDRFLSGKESSAWSEVSKKKKNVQSFRPAGGARHRRGQGRAPERHYDRDRDRDRRERDRPSANFSDSYSNGYRPSRPSASRDAQSNGYSKSQDPQDNSSHPAPRATSPSRDHWGTQFDSDHVVHETSFPPESSQFGDPQPEDQEDTATFASTELNWTDPGYEAQAGQALTWDIQQTAPEPSQTIPSVPEKEEKTALPLSSLASDSGASVTPAAPLKRSFNYAAAAAAGTSHEKQIPSPTAHVSSATVAPSAQPPMAESIPSPPEPSNSAKAEIVDVKKRRNRSGRKQRGRHEGQRPTQNEESSSSPGGSKIDAPPSRTEERSPSQSLEAPFSTPVSIEASTDVAPVRVETASKPPNAWAARAAAKEANEKPLDSAATAVAVSPAAVTGAERPSNESFVLQFGSFSIDDVNWSAKEKPATSVQDKIHTPQPNVSAPVVASGSANLGPTVESLVGSGVETTQAAIPTPPSAEGISQKGMRETIAQPSVPTSEPVQATSGPIANGSGLFPVVPVGATGAFPPHSYGAPYFGLQGLQGLQIPQPFGMGSYDSGSDLSSTRNPNLGPPGPLPLYDPSALSGIPNAGGAKYGGVPGLGDGGLMTGAPVGNPPGKEILQGGTDGEKNGNSASGGVPGGIDSLAAPYMMPGYPYMYGFPPGPYAPPPGMGPPGPSPFPYPAGQVTSQNSYAGYPNQNNLTKFGNAGNAGRVGFGFDDNSSGLSGVTSRNGNGLSDNSVYAPGGYLGAPMSDGVGQKGISDNSAYKNVRNGVGSGVPSVGVPGSLTGSSGVGGSMGYNDYATANQGHSAGLNVPHVGPGGWNNRQGGNGRSEGMMNPPASGNNVLAGTAGNSGIYAPGPGAPGGYWAPSGYY